MRLTLENFFSHLIFRPFDADSRIEGFKALAASLACLILSLGVCHVVCAIRKCWTYRPSKEATEQDQRMSNAAKSALGSRSTPQIPPIEVKIPKEVVNVLDSLFEGSQYSLNTLPVYPIVDDRSPQWEEMTAPIMKGMFKDERPFVAIKVTCQLTDDNIGRWSLPKQVLEFYQENRTLNNVLVLFQYRTTDSLMWDQLDREITMEPRFFTWNFTYPKDGSGQTDTQKDNFKVVQQLLQTGAGTDNNGLHWHIQVE